MITPEYHINPISFVNTSYFCEASTHFLKYGTYCHYPEGTYAYQEYWKEEDRRCREGYEVGGVRITGEHYAYLNFARIKVTVGEGKKARKYESFPRFLDMDYYYYHELEKAKINKEGIIVAKSRRKGFSYKGAFNACYEYNWFRDSFSIIAAFMGDYCQTTMNMALDQINFINKHTCWAKRKLIDTRNHIKSGFREKINNIEVDSGYRSEIMTISFKDNPFKSIGKSGSIMLFEEAGKWSGLIDAYMLSKPLFSDGDIMIGIPIIYGTGGDMTSGTIDFCEMFYNPSAYNLRSYENVWDENKQGECGFFIDDMWFKLPHVDTEGNSDRKKAEQELDLQRDLLIKTGTRRAIEKFITQYPKTPAEAFLRSAGNIFPVAELSRTLTSLEINPIYKDAEYIGELVVSEEGKLVWQNNPKLYSIRDFPLKNSDDTEGCIVIYEHPDEEIDYTRYIAGIDPYDHDTAVNTTSLGSTLIFDRITNRIVAEYTARPETAEKYYEVCKRLLEYYNAVALYENEKKGIFMYFEHRVCTHLLADTPNTVVDKLLQKNSSVDRKKGLHMTKEIKAHGEELVKSFLLEPTIEENKLNLHKIRSVPLLKELIAYDSDGNFDRVMALIQLLYYREEIREKKADKLKPMQRIEDSDFFNKPLFNRRPSWSQPTF